MLLVCFERLGVLFVSCVVRFVKRFFVFLSLVW